jgi:ADP-heptose:LPS heptosyltransferase
MVIQSLFILWYYQEIIAQIIKLSILLFKDFVGMKNKNIDIILPDRIGDSIMFLPFLVCLKQLNEKYNPHFNIIPYSSNSMKDVFSALDLYKFKQINFRSKALSWLFPSEETFYSFTSSKNTFFHSKKKYGERMSNKWYARFDVDTPYLTFDKQGESTASLIAFLKDKYKFSSCTTSFFGFLHELGYTTEQIIETFEFDQNSLVLNSEFLGTKADYLPSKYFVFCMEAAYGKQRDADRRWDENNYIDIAERVYQVYGIESVFIGINRSFEIADKPYFTDLRGKIEMNDLARTLYFSEGYIGNDTGPMHLANMLKKDCVTVYFRENSTTNYNPIYPELNKMIVKPDKVDEVLEVIKILKFSHQMIANG